MVFPEKRKEFPLPPFSIIHSDFRCILWVGFPFENGKKSTSVNCENVKDRTLDLKAKLVPFLLDEWTSWEEALK